MSRSFSSRLPSSFERDLVFVEIDSEIVFRDSRQVYQQQDFGCVFVDVDIGQQCRSLLDVLSEQEIGSPGHSTPEGGEQMLRLKRTDEQLAPEHSICKSQ